jgi:hypothetical protein
MSSVSNDLYFLTLPLVSVMRFIYTSKEMSKMFGVRVIYRKIQYSKQDQPSVHHALSFKLDALLIYSCKFSKENSVFACLVPNVCYMPRPFDLPFVGSAQWYFVTCKNQAALKYSHITCHSFLSVLSRISTHHPRRSVMFLPQYERHGSAPIDLLLFFEHSKTKFI